MSAYERSGFRDEGISRKHRQWGKELTATDIDFLMNEYRADTHQPKAIIDYKHEKRDVASYEDSAVTAQAVLATNAGIPFFIVRYSADYCDYWVFPRNRFATRFIYETDLGRRMDEASFVEFLYKLRDLPKPKAA